MPFPPCSRDQRKLNEVIDQVKALTTTVEELRAEVNAIKMIPYVISEKDPAFARCIEELAPKGSPPGESKESRRNAYKRSPLDRLKRCFKKDSPKTRNKVIAYENGEIYKDSPEDPPRASRVVYRDPYYILEADSGKTREDVLEDDLRRPPGSPRSREVSSGSPTFLRRSATSIHEFQRTPRSPSGSPRHRSPARRFYEDLEPEIKSKRTRSRRSKRSKRRKRNVRGYRGSDSSSSTEDRIIRSSPVKGPSEIEPQDDRSVTFVESGKRRSRRRPRSSTISIVTDYTEEEDDRNEEVAPREYKLRQTPAKSSFVDKVSKVRRWSKGNVYPRKKRGRKKGSKCDIKCEYVKKVPACESGICNLTVDANVAEKILEGRESIGTSINTQWRAGDNKKTQTGNKDSVVLERYGKKSNVSRGKRAVSERSNLHSIDDQDVSQRERKKGKSMKKIKSRKIPEEFFYEQEGDENREENIWRSKDREKVDRDPFGRRIKYVVATAISDSDRSLQTASDQSSVLIDKDLSDRDLRSLQNHFHEDLTKATLTEVDLPVRSHGRDQSEQRSPTHRPSKYGEEIKTTFFGTKKRFPKIRKPKWSRKMKKYFTDESEPSITLSSENSEDSRLPVSNYYRKKRGFLKMTPKQQPRKGNILNSSNLDHRESESSSSISSESPENLQWQLVPKKKKNVKDNSTDETKVPFRFYQDASSVSSVAFPRKGKDAVFKQHVFPRKSSQFTYNPSVVISRKLAEIATLKGSPNAFQTSSSIRKPSITVMTALIEQDTNLPFFDDGLKMQDVTQRLQVCLQRIDDIVA